MPKYGMVIDLQKCVGCGACALACKTENNTQDRAKGQTFNWADYLMKAEGKFPKTKFEVKPVLCNHCTDALCVKALPGNSEGNAQARKWHDNPQHGKVHRMPQMSGRMSLQLNGRG